jgi:ABC-2 type transport system permease protein
MIKKYLKIYRQFTIDSLMIFLTHRFNFIMSGVANVIWTVAQLVSIRYLFQKIPNFQGWGFGDLVLLLSFGQAYFYISWILYDSNLQKIPRKIISGDFDIMLLKPINIKFFSSFQQIAIPQIIVMFTTVTPLIIYGLSFQKNLAFFDILTTGLILILGITIFYFISLGVTALAFFVGNVEAIRYFIIQSPSNLNRVPLNLFPKIVQYILTFVLPLAFLAFYPTLVVKGKISPFLIISTELGLIYLSYCFSSWMWKSGLKNYTSASK